MGLLGVAFDSGSTAPDVLSLVAAIGMLALGGLYFVLVRAAACGRPHYSRTHARVHARMHAGRELL